jgi:large subunit ribosomal protein L12
MEYVYAALLLHKLEKEVTEDSVKAVVTATGVAVDDSKVKSLVASLNGVDIASELANASLASAPAAASAAPAAEEKKEENKPKEEPKAAAADGLASLFG